MKISKLFRLNQIYSQWFNDSNKKTDYRLWDDIMKLAILNRWIVPCKSAALDSSENVLQFPYRADEHK